MVEGQIIMKPGEDLYPKAREILRGEPTMGKKRLAVKLGVKTPTSRRLANDAAIALSRVIMNSPFSVGWYALARNCLNSV